MPGPTEVLSVDVKELRDDIHRVEGSLKEKIHEVETSLREAIHIVKAELTESIHTIKAELTADIHTIKAELTGDIHTVQAELTADIHRVDLAVAKVAAEFNFAKWLIGLTLVATLSGIGGGIWWAGVMDTKMRAIESTLSKLVEQTKPK